MFLKAFRQFNIVRSSHRTVVSQVKNEGFTNSEVPAKGKKKRMPATASKLSNEIKSYFSPHHREYILEKFPEKLLRRKTKTPESLYIVNEDSAKKIVQHLKANIASDKLLIEVNPGIGLLTKHLLNETSNDLLLYESNDSFIPELNALTDGYPDRNITIKHFDMMTIWKAAFQDKQDNGDRIADILKGVPKADWDGDSNARLFAMTGSLSFVKHLINSIIFQNSFFALGRCETFLCLPPPLFLHLTCSNQAGYLLYRESTVLFQILFEYEFIDKINRKHFLPWQSESKLIPHLKMSKFNVIDSDCMYLIRIVPRKDLYCYCMPDKLILFWYFVKQHLVSRKNRVIPSLERWIPGCGPRLIVNTKPAIKPQIIHANPKKILPPFAEPCRELTTEDYMENINIFTEFGDLSPTQMLTLFDKFINWPEFKECPFNASLENSLMKMHNSPEDTADGIGLDKDEEEKLESDNKRQLD